jgi:chromosome segregation ATPase
MANYYVFNPSDPSGKILRYGTCPPEMIAKQAGPGEVAKEGIANDATQKIVVGAVVSKTQEEIDGGKAAPLAEGDYPAGVTRAQWHDLLARLDKAEARVTATETQGTEQQTQIGALQTQVTDDAKRIDGVETRLGAVETQQTDQATRLDSVETRLGAVETQLADHEKRLAAVEAKVGITTV